MNVFMLEAKCVVIDLQSLEDAVSFWQKRESAFNRSSTAEVIMWILMQTEEGQRACEQFSSHSPSQRVSLFPPPKKAPSLPLPKSIILPPAPPPPPSSIHLLPPFLLQRMRGILSILSLCIHSLLSLCLLPMPAISHIFCALVFFQTILFYSIFPSLCLVHPVEVKPILGLASVFDLSAPMSAVNASPTALLVRGYLLHQGQGVH